MSLTTSGGVTIIDTLTVSDEATTEILSSVFTTAVTYLTTVTETLSYPEATDDSLTTYTTAFTEYSTVTETEGPTPTTPGPSVSFPTLIVGGTGEVGGVTIIGALYEVWMFILCPSRDCTPWREWLTYIPNVAAGWVLGAIALLLGLGLLLMTFMHGALEYIFGFLAMALVSICLFIRAGLKDTSADRFAMYKASIWLNYFAAVLLILLIAQMLFRLIVHLDNTLCRAARMLVGLVYVVAIALFALLTAAVVLMFDKHLFSRVHAGIGCLQAFVIVVLVISIILLLATFWTSSNDHKGYHLAHIIIIGLCLVFLLVWGSYMTAREFLDLHSAARHSEALWYVFNIVPLLLIAVVLLVLNAPSMFTFCHCPVNACPVSNPHVRYSSTGAGPHTHSHDPEANVQRYYM
ncbi:hypothetical protein COEREDRAFT_10410 [Coemansia reversa NRRL 1564]|uniref:G-protein coupled receptors family 3 profile domain-containing protein n=1 Tax=Coemansia reversa (strain ATCC 12441 / NRRL 1564) TaxID=763665 RepID=A0A2G5B5T0_COERN|nr:hypothetical protein COEREDRAFT_10410 [Coemansia reversa NRRL 1564]|eukprot:PIA14368.1 hypothetical protein COEREDRAFT_10410 [Coemansia reversa NRRL 1564]